MHWRRVHKLQYMVINSTNKWLQNRIKEKTMEIPTISDSKCPSCLRHRDNSAQDLHPLHSLALHELDKDVQQKKEKGMV